MISDPETLHAVLKEHFPGATQAFEALQATGVPIMHVVHDEETGEVFANTGPGGSYERAHAHVRQQVTGVPYRDPADVDPVLPDAALRDPILRANHVAKMRDMLVYLIEFYRPDLAKHPRLKPAVNYVIEYMTGLGDRLAALPTAYDRWDLIVESTVDWLEELPHQRPGKAEG